MNRIFGSAVLIIAAAINLLIVGAILITLQVSLARIAWMTSHDMMKHEVAYIILGILVVFMGLCTLWEGCKIMKKSYVMLQHREIQP